MNDAKKIKSTKSLKKVKPKKKTKNYITENVKQLKKIKRNLPKSDEEDDRRRLQDHSMSYAEKLKTATSNHLKLMQKLSYFKDVKAQVHKDSKKATVFTMQSKPALPETNNALPDIRPKRPPKTMKRKNDKELKPEVKRMESKIMNKSGGKDGNERSKIESKKEPSETVEKKHESLAEQQNKSTNNPAVKAENHDENPKSDVVFTEIHDTQLAKGYKNEACQARSVKSTESIDSNTVIRFPRKPLNNFPELTKMTPMCEKSLQTEQKQCARQASPASSKNKIIKKTSPLNKDALKLKDAIIMNSKDGKQTRNTNSLTVNNRQDLPSRIPLNKAKLKPNDEKANILLNEIINSSNVDVKKLYSQIGKVQRTSPFARHHTVFEDRSPDEIRKEHSENMKNNPIRAPGTILLPDHKRKEYLAQIKKRHSELLRQLNCLPVNSKSMDVRRQKIQIGQGLNALDNAIKMFSRQQLLIDLNAAESNK